MKKIFTLLQIIFASSMIAQTTIQNGDFELWENVGSSTEEPTFFNSNKTGTDWATSGPQTCYRDATTFHGGAYSVRMETKTFAGFAVVNGSVVTGIVNAPTTNKSDGYIGTIKNTSLSDIRRMAFVGRPDSLVGWYKYTQGGSAELGKVRAILHVGHYYDPEAASSYHPDSSANKIGDALFLTPAANVSTWTRFAVAFNYVSGSNPAYIMINTTSSNDQLTSTAGSKLWLDDLSVVYNPSGISENSLNENDANVYAYDKNIYVDFINGVKEKTALSIYDLTGKLVSKKALSNSQLNTINVSELNSGLYMYQLTGTNIHKSGKLFIK
ncbi:MAG TPA: T9SS type A sorting domain-containing protein [Bacteroidia bacterium]|nr:T9SS type A sorting domain-containing protein [Bacteroidia bacterium]